MRTCRRNFRHSLCLIGVFHAGLLSEQTNNSTKQGRTFNQGRDNQHCHLYFGRHFRLSGNGANGRCSHPTDTQPCANRNQTRAHTRY